MITFRVGGVEFTSNPASGYGLAELKGWESAPPVKTQMRERPVADGAHGLDRFYRSARVVTLSGMLSASTPAESKAQRRAVAGIQANGVPSLVEVEEGGETLSSVMAMIGTPDLDDRLTDCLTLYTLQFMGNDHRKYAASVSVSTGLPTSGGGIAYPLVYPLDYGTPGNPGRIVTENPGDVDSYSLLEVTGGLGGGFELTETQTGQVLRFERVVPLSSTVFLNPRTGGAYLDTPGNDVSGFLTRREWWSVPAQGSREIQFNSIGAVTGTPTLTARTSPAH